MTVYTCTMNLAIDLFIDTQEMKASTVNRTLSSDIQANGKGVNVSLIMKKFGLDTTALGFSAGFTGNYIADYLHEHSISTKFIEVVGFTRINVFTKVRSSNQEYKLVNSGPEVSMDHQNQLLQLIRTFKPNDYLIVSGSLPRGVEPSILLEIAKLCHENQVHLVLDVSHPIILECLQYHPYLIKPNEEELASWFNDKKAMTFKQIIQAGQELLTQGAEHVLISLGAEGAVYFASNYEIYASNAPKGEVVNTACSGDAMLGTFLANQLNGSDTEYCLKKAVAVGSSTAFSPGLSNLEDIADLEKQIHIRKLEEVS